MVKNDKYSDAVNQLTGYFMGLVNGVNGTDLLNEFNVLETDFSPRDIVILFDIIFEQGVEIEKIKTSSNKLFNILYKNLLQIEKPDYPGNNILTYLIEDNNGVKNFLATTRKYNREINKAQNQDTLQILIDSFLTLQRFTEHYTLIQNILFPEIEKSWKEHQCLKLMWSFHDDIKSNIKNTIATLREEKLDLKLYNHFSSKVYFNINTIIFREEHILFPLMLETLGNDVFQKMLHQLGDFKLEYTNPIVNAGIQNSNQQADEVFKHSIIKFPTGEMSAEQIELLFNHLPVDISFVDENDRVMYFSTPRHRIFPRSAGIIGRAVQDCHPHGSIDIVNKIIASFRSGEKDMASFRIQMGSKFVLIQYFAMRDKDNHYRGVVEVSQEISEIQSLEGEKRLLDW